MEVLELKKPKKKVISFMAKHDKVNLSGNEEYAKIVNFMKNKGVRFVTLDVHINLKDFRKTEFAQMLERAGIPYYQVDIPEYAMGYIYEEIVEKEDLMNELFDEYEKMEDKDSFKGESLKNWIDMLKQDIEQKENYISLRLRPQWIVKKMLDIAKTYKENEVAFLHFVQSDICEDICPQVTENLRNLGVKVNNYNVKKNLKDIIAKI